MSYSLLLGDPRAPGTVNPAGDMNNANDVLAGMGGYFNIWNTAFSGGADPTGSTDSTAAIRAALAACPPGGTVFVPPVYWTGSAWAQATYKISGPLVVPFAVALCALTESSTLAYYGGSIPMQLGGAIFLLATSFTGATYGGQATMGSIVLLSEVLGGYSNGSGNHALCGITINGENCTTPDVNGLEAWGPVWGVRLDNVGIYGMPQYGAVTSTSTPDGTGKSPDLWRVKDLHIAACGSDGWNATGGLADTYFGFSESTGNGGHGWNISGANQRWSACKSEENDGDGWHISAPGGTGAQGSFGTWMTGCSTDHNKDNGVWIGGANGAGPFSLDGCTFHADGANELTSAGVRVSADNVVVLLSNVRVQTYGTSPTFPYYGVRNDGTNSSVYISSGLVGGATAALDESSTGVISVGDQVVLYTGEWDGGTITPAANPVANAVAPGDLGYLAWSFDSSAIAANTVLGTGGTATAGELQLIKIPVRQPLSTTGIELYLGVLGSGLTSTENYVFLFTSTGTLIAATADQTSVWNTGGGPLGGITADWASGPFTVQPPFVWAAVVYNGTTGPSFGRSANLTASIANGQLAAAQSRYGHILTGVTTAAPGNFTPSSITQLACQLWAALF